MEAYNAIEIFSSINVIFKENIPITVDFKIPEYVNFVKSFDRSATILKLNIFGPFHSLNQCNSTTNINGLLFDLNSNVNCDVNVAPNGLVPINSHHPSQHIHFVAARGGLNNKVRLMRFSIIPLYRI